MTRLSIAFGCALLAAMAQAETVATCGASKGYGYYIPKGPVPIADAGWTEDTIAKGTFQLIRSNDGYDIIITDTRGGPFSARADGAEVVGWSRRMETLWFTSSTSA